MLNKGRDPQSRHWEVRKAARAAKRLYYRDREIRQNRRKSGWGWGKTVISGSKYSGVGKIQSATVNCMGSRHTILLTYQGKLSFPNHPDGWDEIRTLQVFDPRVRCRCLEVSLWWKLAISVGEDGLNWGNERDSLISEYPWLPEASKKFRDGEEITPAYLRALLPEDFRALSEDARERRLMRDQNGWRVPARFPGGQHYAVAAQERFADAENRRRRWGEMIHAKLKPLGISDMVDLVPNPRAWLRGVSSAQWFRPLLEDGLFVASLSPVATASGEILGLSIRNPKEHRSYMTPRYFWTTITESEYGWKAKIHREFGDHS